MKTWIDVDKMSADAKGKGKYKDKFKNNDNKSPADFPTRAENYRGEDLGIKTLEEWQSISADLISKCQQVLDGTLIPTWDMLTYRSEKDFRAGSFSSNIGVWPIFINALETEKLKGLAYKIITSGLSVSDNQANISPENRIRFRKQLFLCTGQKVNQEYEYLIKKGVPTAVAQNGKEYIIIGGNKYPRKCHYVMEAKRIGKTGKFSRKKFYQKNQKRILEHPEEMQKQIEKWCDQGVLKHLGHEDEIDSDLRTSLVLAYHEVKKAFRICYDGGPSKVTQEFLIDCKLNSIYDALSLLEPGDYMSKLDDKSGFLQVKFDRSSQELSHVKWGKEIFEFFGAIFGVSRVPADFQLINSCVVSFLRKEGIPITLYLDDRLVIEKKMNQLVIDSIEAGKIAPRNVWLTHALIIASGGYISKKKSTFICQQRLEFLGFIIDTKKQTVEIPEEKWTRVQNTITEMRKSRKFTFKCLEKLQGTLCSFLVVITNMQLYIRRITEKMKSMAKENESEGTLDDRLDDELDVWQDLSRNAFKLERHWVKKEPTAVDIKISTDASTSNGGWIEPDGTPRTIPWTKEEAKLHITLKEAIIIRKYLEQHEKSSENSRITFLCDNQGVVKTFEKGSKDPKLNDEIRSIRLLGCKLNAILSIEWVSTEVQEADEASRTIDIREEILIDEVYIKLNSLLNSCCEIDLCATFANKKCKRYYSRYIEENAEGHNAFSYKGPEMVYVFPPKAIANALFIKLLEQETRFVGIFHTYSETPIWVSKLPQSAQIIALNENWLKNNILLRL